MITLYSKTRIISKMLLIMMFAIMSTTIYAVVLYPANDGDPIVHLAMARMLFDYGTLRDMLFIGDFSPWLLYYLVKEKGLALLVAILTRLFAIDIYWIHTFVTPVTWGLFVPLTTYKIAKMLGREKRFSIFAAFLTAFYSGFIIWGSIATANSIGFMFFFVSLYFSMRYLKSEKNRMLFLVAMVVALTSGFMHPLAGLMSLTFLFLAIALRFYENVKTQSTRRAYLTLSFAFLSSVLFIFAVFSLNNMLYLVFAPPGVRARYQNEIISFNFSRLLGADPWELIFSGYANFSFRDTVLLVGIPILGLIGFAYALKEKKKFDKLCTYFLFLAFLISIIDHRILQNAMINVPFGPSRILVVSNFTAIPFASLTVFVVIRFLEGKVHGKSDKTIRLRRWTVIIPGRRTFAAILIGLSLSAFALASLHRAYYLGGLHFTELEVEAIKRIEENTEGRYIVLSNMIGLGWGFVGLWNPEKVYVYDLSFKGKNVDLSANPSVEIMASYMNSFRADTGYFVVTFRNPDFDRIVAEASRIFGLFDILSNENGKIYIFYYKVPPFPVGPDINAFYWEAPASYYVQTDLARVVFNNDSKSLDILDPSGYLYESVDLNATMVDGISLGRMLSLQYYVPSNGTWIYWNPYEKIPFGEIPELRNQFRLKLNFERASLVSVVEKGKSDIKVWWEGGSKVTMSLRTGDFTRLYIPGLVDGINNYDVISGEYGLLYTEVLNDAVQLHPAVRYDISKQSLTFRDIMAYANLNITTGYLYYDFYVDNIATSGQWSFVEVWLPDQIYKGIIPPIAYSIDEGDTWTSVASTRAPIQTIGGTYVKWVVTKPRELSETPAPWSASLNGDGDPYNLPGQFTESGGGQNRFILGVYLPYGDRVLVRLGASIYKVRPLKVSYVFKDSGDVYYGLHNMEEGLIKLYNYWVFSYLTGLQTISKPTSLVIEQDETGRVRSILIDVSSNDVLTLFAEKDIDTTVDLDGDGVPDNI